MYSKRILVLMVIATIVAVLFSSVALADRDDHRHDWDRHHHGYYYREGHHHHGYYYPAPGYRYYYAPYGYGYYPGYGYDYGPGYYYAPYSPGFSFSFGW